ncbi:hypothetical protein ACFVUS_25050 [Nocardia sp. NPDC058058]|uniref:hypothetical protein n=1 Tax=Nocardia sp. NPDC058058 TaxID=3346317 RepID=UPI0036D99509
MTALDDLKVLLPPPSGYGRSFDWTTVERGLGVATIPEDFKLFFEAYGDVSFCDRLCLFRPSSNEYVDLAEVTFASRENLAADDIGDPPGQIPAGVSVDPSTLIQWGASFGGNYCLWDAHDPDPDKWTLVFTDADQIQRGFYAGTVTSYLVDWLTGNFTPIPMWTLSPGTRPFVEFYEPDNPHGPVIVDRVDAARTVA